MLVRRNLRLLYQVEQEKRLPVSASVSAHFLGYIFRQTRDRQRPRTRMKIAGKLCCLFRFIGLDRSFAINGLRSNEQSQSLSVVTKTRGLQECQDLSHVFDQDKGKCSQGREFGKSCKSDSSCYSKHCGVGKAGCTCPAPSDCWGCSSDAAPCVRIEQPHPSLSLNICQLEVYENSNTGKKSDLFSAGGAHTSDYDLLPLLIQGLSSISSRCASVVPYRSDGFNDLPPAFLQANVNTESANDIDRLEMVGLNVESFIDSLVFVNGNWVT